MIGPGSILAYRGPALLQGESFLYLPPHPVLSPYISCYTITCPTPSTMSDAYTVLPTASSTLVYSAGEQGIVDGLRGVNTQPANVGRFANRFALLVLIEFRPGGLYPFVPVDQEELADAGFRFSELAPALHQRILEALLRACTVENLVDLLDQALCRSLEAGRRSPQLDAVLERILATGGNATGRELAGVAFYSDKQLGRLFRRQFGTGVKSFSRIVRVNRVLHMLGRGEQSLTQIAALAGYFDQAHSIRDFRAVCGVTPGEYLRKMSVLYNDDFKL